MPTLFHPGLGSLNPIQIYFPPFSNNNNKIWIPIITTEYDLGEKSKHSSNCDLLQFPAEVNKLCKHKRLQKILPVLVKTVFKWMQVVLVRLQYRAWVFPQGHAPSSLLNCYFCYKSIGAVNLELGFNRWIGIGTWEAAAQWKEAGLSQKALSAPSNDALRSEISVLPCKGIGLKEEQRRAHLAYSQPSKWRNS